MGGDIFGRHIEVGCGFRFPSISLHKKLSQLLVGEGRVSPANPALLILFQSLFFQTEH